MANFLTFASAESFTIAVYNTTKNWDGTLYYSTDAATWNEWDGTTTISSAEHDGEHRIYMRGVGNTVITGQSTFSSTTHKYDGKYSWVLTGSNIRCIGNIENLLDYKIVANKKHPTMAPYCYMGMFNENASLISAPELRATILSSYCYAYMFCRCTGLTTAPKLPATALERFCYAYMFFACSKLTTATALPATTLFSSCYSHMFSSCSKLETLPELPACTLAKRCYDNMFSDCSRIKVSKTQSEEYHTPYRVPSKGSYTGSETEFDLMYAMFWYAGGSTSISWPTFGVPLYTSNTIIPSGIFDIPKVYVPYVNTAKNIFDVQCGKAYSSIAVAENENYISVHFLADNFELVTYDSESTIYTATGIAFVTYDKRTDKWSAEVVDNMESVSEGSRYISHWVWSEVDVDWGDSVIFTNQEGWHYNSTMLLDVNLKWTDELQDVFPYGLIASNSTSGSFRLFVSDHPWQFDGSKIFSLNTSYMSFYTSEGVLELLWSNSNSGTNVDVYITEEDFSCDKYVWTSHDILNEDGSVYIPASEPVHVTYVVEEVYDETSFKIGMALGLCGKGVPTNMSVTGSDDVLDSTSFESGYKAGAELRRLRS